jgi:hypothetical protein
MGFLPRCRCSALLRWGKRNRGREGEVGDDGGAQALATAGREGDVARASRRKVERAIARVGRSGCWARPLASVRAHDLLGRLG